MISSEEAISFIKTNLIELIESGTLNGSYQQSNTTISFYVYRNASEELPLLTLRTSDHRPTLQNYLYSRNPMPSETDDTNLSIEFYKPKIGRNNLRFRNRLKNSISIPVGANVPNPFTVSSYSYSPQKLDIDDIKIIYESILEWIFAQPRQTFIDPFANTAKKAKVSIKTVMIKVSVAQNISMDKDGLWVAANEDGADFISESRQNKTKHNII